MESSIEEIKTSDTTLIDTSIVLTDKPDTEELLRKNEDTRERIVNYHEAPEFLRDNEFILRGYRINFNSTKKIFKSLFMLHNESVNVWSHIIGSILIILLFIYTGLFIKKHYLDVEEVQNKLNYFKEEIYSLKTPFFETIQYFDNFTEKFEKSKHLFSDYVHHISDQTSNYFHLFEERLGEYRDFISTKIKCLECIKGIYSNLTNYTENFIQAHVGKLKEKLIDETSFVMNSFNISKFKNYLNKTNQHLISLRDDLIEKLESKEMEWIDINKFEKINSNNNVKKWPLFVFLFGAIACLSMSATFHLCFVYSKEFSEFLARLDYAGISLLIAGSCFPLYYYSYFCMPFFKILYLVLISTICLSIFLFSLTKSFSQPSKRKLRGIIFLFAGISTAFPIIHLLFIKGNPGMIQNQSFSMFILGGLAYIVGAVIYIMRVPEKHCPGTFCIWGSSHQIWHCLVITGIVLHYYASIEIYHERLGESECPVI